MSTTTKARLVFGWALVGIPLAYGGYETLVKTASLFTGWMTSALMPFARMFSTFAACVRSELSHDAKKTWAPSSLASGRVGSG